MTIKINEEPWNIIFVKHDDSILYIGNGIYTLGCTVPKLKAIFISDEIYGDILKRVVSHEIAHAEFYSRGLVVPEYLEEVLSDIISDNIVDVYNLTTSFCRLDGRC